MSQDIVACLKIFAMRVGAVSCDKVSQDGRSCLQLCQDVMKIVKCV